MSATMATNQSSLKLALLLLLPYTLVAFHFVSIYIHALNIGVQSSDATVAVNKPCSKKCESEHCSVPPFLRYGKYCGLLYSGCPGEKPCDGLDSCCMKHDLCIQAHDNDYLSLSCSQGLLDCMDHFKKTGAHTFQGNQCDAGEVVDVISVVIDAALVAGRALHRP